MSDEKPVVGVVVPDPVPHDPPRVKDSGPIAARLAQHLLRRMSRPEPPPNAGRPVWDMVRADFEQMFTPHGVWSDDVLRDMAERDQVGRAKYGTPLQTHNGRDALVDAYQETLDQAVYLRQDMEERPGEDVHVLYRESLGLLYRLRGLIATRQRR